MTFLLVPGAGGDPFYWHRVVPRLEAAGHRVVVVDLPTEDPDAGLAAYGDAIAAAGADLADVTLVAQSMGGFSAPLAVDRLDLARLVLVNAMVPRPGESADGWADGTGHTEARAAADRAAGRDPDAPFDAQVVFFHDVPDDVRDRAFGRGEKGQAARPFGEPWPLEAWPDVPTSGVAGADDRLFPTSFQRRVARERLGVELDVVPGGHLPALSRPDELTAYLLGT